MERLTSFAFLTALASLSLAGGCSKSDGGGSPDPQQPGAPTATAPQPEDPGSGAAPGDDGQAQRGGQNMPMDERRAARRAERLKQYDSNADGRLDRQEREAMRAAAIDKRMQRIDRDGDGRISRQEAQSGRIGPRLLADFDRADANRDSTISREELGAAIEEYRARRRAERQAGGAAAAPAGTPAAPPAEDDADSLDDE